MSQRQLIRELRELRNEERILRAEEYDLTDSPDGIQHFENYYLKKGASVEEVRMKLEWMHQFPRALKKHILDHYEVKREIRRLNKKLWRLRK